MMSTSVEILSPRNDAKLQRALGTVKSARYAKRPSSKASQRILVAWLSDLNSAHYRQELEELVGLVIKGPGEVPFVLIEAKQPPPTSGDSLQALVHWTTRLGREPYIAPDARVLRRMILARQSKAERQLIASASIDKGKLVVWTCEPRRYEVPISLIPSLARMKPRALSSFELSESGSRIHWDDDDVDLTAETICAYADPELRRQQEAQRRHEAARYADAIRELREERGLRQADIKGLTERQIRRLEEGDTRPRTATLEKLAAGHEMAVDDYLKALAKRSSRAMKKAPERKAAAHGIKKKPPEASARQVPKARLDSVTKGEAYDETGQDRRAASG
jgi:transcriptional regulator with XRE-family HTH domain